MTLGLLALYGIAAFALGVYVAQCPACPPWVTSAAWRYLLRRQRRLLRRKIG